MIFYNADPKLDWLNSQPLYRNLADPKTKPGENMKTSFIFLATLLSLGVASAHIPVTESATILDANIDGSTLAGNYRVKDACDGGFLKKPNSSGLVMVKFDNAYENLVAGVQTKSAELSYTYLRKQGGSNKFEVKTGKIVLNKLRKISDVKKVDDQIVDKKERLESEAATVVGDLAQDDGDGNYPVKFNDDGSIEIQGKHCDARVTMTPTKDTVP